MAGVNAVSVQVDFRGAHDLVRVSKERAITRKVVTRMARIVQPAVKSEAPVRQGGGGGSLKKSIGVKTVIGRRSKTGVFGVVGARMKYRRMIKPRGRNKPIEAVPGFYQHLVALGTRPHSLASGSKVARRGSDKQSIGQHMGKMHPGAKANNFLARAWAEKSRAATDEGLRISGEEYSKAIAAASAKLAAKGK